MTAAARAADGRAAARKFENPDRTLKGEVRARVPLDRLETLWFNTGTLCNITCQSCYIESSPRNDRLVYLSSDDVRPFLDEAAAVGVREIGFTGGEPFLNAEAPDMIGEALARGFEVLVLTNGMLPMQRPAVKAALIALRDRHAGRLTLRVSLDHYTRELHERERGARTWEPAMRGIDWLSQEGFRLAIAGRTCWHETEAFSRAGYRALLAARGWRIDSADPRQLVLFPEMDTKREVPEISTGCWAILGKHPSQMMCARSRMVVKRKGAAAPVVLPCTLLPYDPAFEMGATLRAAAAADGGMFDQGAVKLCHSHCATFCVLGGGSCS